MHWHARVAIHLRMCSAPGSAVQKGQNDPRLGRQRRWYSPDPHRNPPTTTKHVLSRHREGSSSGHTDGERGAVERGHRLYVRRKVAFNQRRQYYITDRGASKGHRGGGQEQRHRTGKCSHREPHSGE